MAFSKDLISYSPKDLKSFRIIGYEWIDNLNFTLNPDLVLSNSSEYVLIAKEMFLNAGWNGDGTIELIWIPPFMFKGEKTEDFTKGIIVWHVKQKEDGLSWILSPIELPCETEFE